jgi:oxygen-independent coproporphyrinogen-3 oxidase
MRFEAPRSAYVHIPFCAAKCGYCDFNSFAGMLHLVPRYTDALCRQISSAAGVSSGLDTVYFGGGTPTLMPADALARVLGELRRTFGLADGAEATLEANPESASYEKLAAARDAGFNRVSIGVQSFDGAQLATLGRVHTRDQAVSAFSAARRAGFQNISLDLMFGLPGQTLSDLYGTLACAIDLGPEHLSAYSLTIEEGTPLFERVRAGEVTPPDDDLAADMYQAVRETLTRAGYEHYEISNYALPAMRCRHNEGYWRNDPYLGFGAGAAQYVAGERLTWEAGPLAFTGQNESEGRARVAFSERLEGRALLGETAMLALRTSGGLDLRRLSLDFGEDVEAVFGGPIRRFSQAGLIAVDDGRVTLTAAGQLLANEVLAEFLA